MCIENDELACLYSMQKVACTPESQKEAFNQWQSVTADDILPVELADLKQQDFRAYGSLYSFGNYPSIDFCKQHYLHPLDTSQCQEQKHNS